MTSEPIKPGDTSPAGLPEPPAHADNHGGTVANWTANGIIVLAFLVATIGVVMGNRVVFICGAVLVPIGLIVGKVLSGMGYGASHHDS